MLIIVLFCEPSIFTEAARDLAATETEMATIDAIETEIRVDDDREADPKPNATQFEREATKYTTHSPFTSLQTNTSKSINSYHLFYSSLILMYKIIIIFFYYVTSYNI